MAGLEVGHFLLHRQASRHCRLNMCGGGCSFAVVGNAAVVTGAIHGVSHSDAQEAGSVCYAAVAATVGDRGRLFPHHRLHGDPVGLHLLLIFLQCIHCMYLYCIVVLQ